MALSFFALLDNITSMMEDVATMTKVATTKTAGVLGDDLAVNANQLQGIPAKRELPVLWKIVQGSLINKAILVPLALLLSGFFPQSVIWLLLAGGVYLCFEGTEKLLEWLMPSHPDHQSVAKKTVVSADVFEKTQIKSAVRTDFVLSAEIVVIALGILQEAHKPFKDTVISLTVIAIVLTFAVYGVVAIIIKLDDIGLYWVKKYTGLLSKMGEGLLWFAPRMLKMLTVIGTVAMFVVGGHIWISHIPALKAIEEILLFNVPAALKIYTAYGLSIISGVIVGWLSFLIIEMIIKFFHVVKKAGK